MLTIAEKSFKGTRILVKDVLEQIAGGMTWEAIIEEWRGSLRKEAIAQAEIKYKINQYL